MHFRSCVKYVKFWLKFKLLFMWNLTCSQTMVICFYIQLHPVLWTYSRVSVVIRQYILWDYWYDLRLIDWLIVWFFVRTLNISFWVNIVSIFKWYVSQRCFVFHHIRWFVRVSWNMLHQLLIGFVRNFSKMTRLAVAKGRKNEFVFRVKPHETEVLR